MEKNITPLNEHEVLFIGDRLLDHYILLFPELDEETISGHVTGAIKHIAMALEMVVDIRTSGAFPKTAYIRTTYEYV